jgi:hypothetical protein
MTAMDTKKCTKCELVKPLDDFYKGRAQCKDCMKAAAADRYAALPAEEKARTPEQLEAHRVAMRDARKKAREKSPEQYKAERAAKQAEWREKRRLEDLERQIAALRAKREGLKGE